MRIRSAAKINLFLNVLGRRADGYHELQTVMQSVSLYDELILQPSAALDFHAPEGLTAEPQDNLVYRAARIFIDRHAPGRGVSITLHKNIPVAAGLAGGSTDCAGALVGLNIFFGLRLPLAKLKLIADELGSDTAYCLCGGACLARGRGELLTALPGLSGWPGLLLKPPFALSTAAVYARVSARNTDAGQLADYAAGRVTLQNLRSHLQNDLYAPALEIRPALAAYLDAAAATRPVACQMSGSGPAIFAFYQDKKSRDNAVFALKNAYEIYPVETVPSAQIIESI